MNKIILDNDNIKAETNEKNIKYEFNNNLLGVNELKLEILNDTDLELIYKLNDYKLETQINIKENKKLNIIEKLEGKNIKLRSKYALNEKSDVTITKINDTSNLKEYAIINLNGKKANIKYNLKTIATTKEEYDILTYHNMKESHSEIITNGINLVDGTIKFNVSSFVPKNIKNCVVIQKNKIINQNELECIIKPNLYIDESDVEASHSAWIGKLNEEEIFYMRTRGINEYEATKLLAKGFITSEIKDNDLKEKLNNKLDNYWR